MGVNDVIKIIGIGLLTLVGYIVVKPIKPEIAIFISLAGSCIILVTCIDALSAVISSITNFVEKTGIDNSIISLILKVIGIGYLCEFASNLCNDAGNSLIAERITFAGKVCILILSLPIVVNLLNIIIELLP